MIPVNAGLAYFGTIGLHEGGHAITALALGADDVSVTVLPTRDDEGNLHLGYTKAYIEGGFSDSEATLFNTMGPAATFLGHAGSRLLLRSGEVPKIIQPTVAWFGLFNGISFYYQTIQGIARKKDKDLGKEDIWISIVMLSGVAIFDLVDFFTDEDDRYFGVLFGEDFYEPKKETSNLRFIVTPQKGGGFVGIGGKF